MTRWWGSSADKAPADLAPVTGQGREAFLQCRGINAGYDKVQILFDVDLDVEQV